MGKGTIKRRIAGRALAAGLVLAPGWDQPAPAQARQADNPRGEVFYHVFVRSFRDANGDRIGDPAKARALAAMIFVLRGEPLVYYGQEPGMRGVKGPAEPTDAPDIPRREAFAWRADADAPGTATWYRALDRVWARRINRGHDGVSVEEQDHAPGSLLNWYRRLIALRRSRPELDHGAQAFPCVETSPVLCIARRARTRRTLALINLSGAPAAPVFAAGPSRQDFSVQGLVPLAGEGAVADPIPAYGVRIVGTR